MANMKLIKNMNMVVCIDTPAIEIHKYCLVNWLNSSVTLMAHLDGTYSDDQGIHYEFNGKKIFHTKNNLVNFHVEMLTSKDLMKIATPYPVNILISAWISPDRYHSVENELKEYDLSVFKYNNQYVYNSYLNNYIHYKKPVFEIKKYVILNEQKAVIRKWAQNFKQTKNTINYYLRHGLKFHALCISEIHSFYKILNFDKKTMMRWLIYYKFLLPIER